MMNRKLMRLLTAVLAAGTLAFSFGGCSDTPPTEPVSNPDAVQQEDPSLFPKGAVVGDVDLSGMTLEEALTACRAHIRSTLDGIQITVKAGDETVTVSGKDAEIIDILDVTLSRLLKNRTVGPKKAPYTLRLTALEEMLEQLGEQVNQPVKNPNVTGYNAETQKFEFEGGENGTRLNVKRTVEAVIQQMISGKSGTVDAVMDTVEVSSVLNTLQREMSLISEFETVSSNTANGNHNMGLALQHINGTILKPGDEFSFERIVGDSTHAGTGFLPAGGLSGGALVQMYGGGICQAATTVYGAALRAGMTITMRDCHSSPSTYCDIGLDATVSYREIDFRFRNDLETPIYIMCWMDGVTLHVQFYGKHPTDWDYIIPYSETTKVIKPLDTVRYVVDRNLKKGEKVLSTSGNYGYTTNAWRTYYKDGEALFSEALPSSYYPATGKIYRIGEGTSTAEPSPSPDPSASPEPSTTPDPGVTPAPSPQPSATPEPTPEPSPETTSEPTSEPDPVG